MTKKSMGRCHDGNDGHHNLDYVLHVAIRAVLLAGKEIRNALSTREGLVGGADASNGNNDGKTIPATTKAKSKNIVNQQQHQQLSTDLVTETDEKCEQLILDVLKENFPNDEIIGEETCG